MSGPNDFGRQPAAPYVAAEAVQPPGRGKWSCLFTCFVICSTIALLLAIALGIGAWYVYKNGTRIVVTKASEGIQQAINQSELDPAQKQAINAQLDRLIAHAKELTVEDIKRVGPELAQSPLLPLVPVVVFDTAYVKKSGLNAEQRAEVQRSLQRVARGVIHKQISEAELKTLMDQITTPGSSPDNREIKKSLTDQEILDFSASCRDLADQHKIPDENFQIDLAKEIERLVDRLLKSPSAEPDAEATSLPSDTSPTANDEAAAAGDDSSDTSSGSEAESHEKPAGVD